MQVAEDLGKVSPAVRAQGGCKPRLRVCFDDEQVLNVPRICHLDQRVM